MIRRWVTSYREYAWVIGLGLGVQAELWFDPLYVSSRASIAPVALGMTMALLFRCRAPLLTLGIALIGVHLLIIANTAETNDPILTVFLVMTATYSAGAHTRGRALLLAALLVSAIELRIIWSDPESHNVAGLLFFGVFIVAPFLVGIAVRFRRDREELLVRERDERARQAVADERARIARELHDVVAHAISVIVLQARGARRSLAADPDDSLAALHAIEHTATEALREMRHLLAILRSDEEATLAPQPSLAHLETLVVHVQRTGLAVDVHVHGKPRELAPGLDASAYRIVQEALTNALKHAGRCRATVTIRYDDGTVDLDVADDGTGTTNGEAGHGLIGMRERAALFGGTVDAGPRQGGGYVVHAHLPTGRS